MEIEVITIIIGHVFIQKYLTHQQIFEKIQSLSCQWLEKVQLLDSSKKYGVKV